ncbi:Fc.00g110200.m01.CDS01 [Cosmosporella sp. VM-42]
MPSLRSIVATAAIALLQTGSAHHIELPACLDPFQPYIPVGCFQDTGTVPALMYRSSANNQQMTVEKCVAECKGNGFRYAGLKYYGVCYCGTTVNGPQTDDSQCNLPCSGDNTETCGGNDQLSVWSDPTFVTGVHSIADYKPLGCYTDTSSKGRALSWPMDLDSSTMTPSKCLTACGEGGFPLAGLEYGGECWCGMVLANSTSIANSLECNMPCNGDPLSMCGSGGRLNVWISTALLSLQPCGWKPDSSSSATIISTTTVQPSSTAVSSTSSSSANSAFNPADISSSSTSTTAITPADESTTVTTTPNPDTTATPNPDTTTTPNPDTTTTPNPDTTTTPNPETTKTPSPDTTTTPNPETTTTPSPDTTTTPNPDTTTTPNPETTKTPSPDTTTTPNPDTTTTPNPETTKTPSPDTTTSINPNAITLTDTTTSPNPSTTTSTDTTISPSPTTTTSTDTTTSPNPSTTTSTDTTTSPNPDTTTSTDTTTSPNPDTTTSTDTTTSAETTTSADTTTSLNPDTTTPVTTSTTSPLSSTTSVTTSTTALTTSTTASAALCTTTITLPSDCEYKCGSWCAPSVPDFQNGNDCLNTYKTCAKQVAACFKKAGWPGALGCFDFSSWCKNIKGFCGSTCSGGRKCAKKDCLSKYKPVGGSSIKTTTSVGPCAATTSTVPAAAATSVAPEPTNICKQPTNTQMGYGPGNPVAGIDLPLVGCNDIKSDFTQKPFKLYTDSNSSKCNGYSRNNQLSACTDACKEQYNNCQNVYVTSCKNLNGKNYFARRELEASGIEKRWFNKWSGDKWQTASSKCATQYADCLYENKKVNAATHCTKWGTGI